MDGDLWSEESEYKPIATKAFSRKVWKENFVDVKIGRVAKDACGTCWDFKNKMKKFDAISKRSLATECEDSDEGNMGNDNNSTTLVP